MMIWTMTKVKTMAINPTILIGAAGSGKTSLLIAALLESEEGAFWNESWVLLPTRLQTEAFREALTKQAGTLPLFNIRFFEVYELYNHILNLASVPQRTIHQAAADRILRHVIDGLQLPYYQRIADKPGFVQLVGDFIKELKQSLVTPEAFAAYAHRPKDHDIARIYTGYQQFLQASQLVDRDGAGWVALECLRQAPPLAAHVGLLAVDGFDNFTPLQVELLNALAGQAEESLLTLTYEEQRQHDAGRIFARTLERLTRRGVWVVQPHQPSHALPRLDALRHLERELFAIQPRQTPALGALHLIEAPDPRNEVKAVLRAIKTLLLGGAHPESILVVMRDVGRYAAALRQSAAAYGVPAVVRQPESVLSNPAVRMVLGLLDLHRYDFPRRQLLDVLRSPYFHIPDLNAAQVDILEAVSMARPIVRGKKAWLRGLAARQDGRNDDDENPLPYTHTEREQAGFALEAFFARVTPPSHAPARDYIGWVEALLGDDPLANALDRPTHPPEAASKAPPDPHHLNLYHQIRSHDDAIMARDLYAMHSLRRALLEVLAAYDLLADITNQGVPLRIAWESFRADLELALQNRHDQPAPSRAGRVLITTVYEGRGLPHAHVFIVGLSEGIFPAQITEDPLYSDFERAQLEKAGIEIVTATDRQRDTGLFYEMCALAQTSLTLSHPTLDDGGNEWTPSVFWGAVQAVLANPNFTRLPLGAAPPLAKTANLREAAVAVSQALSAPATHLDENAWAGAAWLQKQSVWANLHLGREVELQRESPTAPFDQYSGVLRHPMLIERVAQLLNTDRLWSASQFNELGQCAFRFFAKRVLGLARYEEPEEGLDVLKLGSLNHKILENTYRRLADGQVIIDEGSLAFAQRVLRQEAESVFATAARDFGFQETPFWEQEKANLMSKLERLIALDFSPQSPLNKFRAPHDTRARITLLQEAPFGALQFVGVAGTLQARGFIDRMDVIGDEVVVVDYKSGSSMPKNKDIVEGRNFQMVLYLLAAYQILQREGLPYSVRGGLFWSIQSNKADGVLSADDALITQARHQIHFNVEAARAGRFPNKPSKMEGGKCYQHCEYSQFCRVNRASRQKPDA